MKKIISDKKTIFIAVAALVLIGAVCILAFTGGSNNIQDPNIQPGGITSALPVDSQIGSEVESQAPQLPTVDPVKDNINKDIIDSSEDIKDSAVGVTYPLKLENGALTVNRFIKYSGRFTEDLSFDDTKDALALELVNTSGKYIEVAVVTFKTADGGEASFWVSRLAPGDVTIVQEKNNMKYSESLVLTPDEVTIGYMNKWDTSISKYLSFKCTTDAEGNNVAVIINTSKKTLSDVKVWYKRNIDDVYIGGYTYALNIEKILPGETLYMQAQFFNTECIVIDAKYTVK